MNIAILPIKSDSKRIPMKLFKDLCGKPLFMHVVDQVMRLKNNYGIIDKVIVTSPDEWFIRSGYLENAGIDYIQRPQELAGDVELTEVIKHAASQVAKSGDNILQIQLNKPLTKASDIMECLNEFIAGGYDSLSTTQRINTCLVGDYVQSSRTKENILYKSQAICKIWKYDTLMNSKNKYSYGEKHRYYEIKPWHIEIDTEDDWRIAEALYRAGF